MHRITGVGDPAAAAVAQFDDAFERRDADRAVGVSAVGLALTGVVELVIALFTGSVGLLSDALHNLSDVSTSAVVFLGFRLSRRVATPRYPYGWERAEDLAGLGVALVVWASAVFAGIESVRKLLSDQGTSHVGAGIAAAAVGIIGLLRALTVTERRVVLAHETSHLRHRHPWWVLAADLTAAVNPLLRPTARTVAQAVERWADEDAASAVADRTVAARTLARTALVTHRSRSAAAPVAPPAVGVLNGDVPRRVEALLAPAPRHRPGLALTLIALTLTGLLAAAAVQHTGERLFEHVSTPRAATFNP